MEKELYEAIIELQYKSIEQLVETNKKILDFIYSSNHLHK